MNMRFRMDSSGVKVTNISFHIRQCQADEIRVSRFMTSENMIDNSVCWLFSKMIGVSNIADRQVCLTE